MRILQNLLFVLIVLLLLAACWQPLHDHSDFWAHAAVGRWMVEHRRIPVSALFLWSYKGPWIAHSWLAELACYGLMAIGGTFGGAVLAVTLTVPLVIAAFLIALRPFVRQRRLPFLPAIIATAAVLAAMPRFSPRPELFTTLFVPLLYLILTDLRAKSETGKQRWIVGIPILFVFWTNLHGAVLFGLAALWLAALCDLMQYRDTTAKRLMGVAVVSSLCLLINPYGARYLQVFAPLATHSFSYIAEWKPFWQHPVMILPTVYDAIIVLAAAILFAAAPARRWAALAWLLLALGAFLQARRSMDLLALTGLFVFSASYATAMNSAHALAFLRKWRQIKPLRTLYFAAGIGWCALLMCLIFRAGAAQYGQSFVEATRDDVPWRQAAFLAQPRFADMRALDMYNAASYLEWGTGGRPALFIDGLNAYPESTFTDWKAMWDASPRGLKLLDSDRIDCVIGKGADRGEILPPLDSYLSKDPQWHLVYGEDDGPVWIRK